MSRSKKPDAPEWALMQLHPAPVTGLSYTIEFRFRITRCNLERRYSHPLVLNVRTKGLCCTQINIGQRDNAGRCRWSLRGRRPG